MTKQITRDEAVVFRAFKIVIDVRPSRSDPIFREVTVPVCMSLNKSEHLCLARIELESYHHRGKENGRFADDEGTLG